jgi:glycosyltransferase involved in cell wall biosynthesis
MPNRPRPVKILRIITRLNVGGPAKHVTILTRDLNDRDWHSLLVAGRVGPFEGSVVEHTRQQGVEPILINELVRPTHPINDVIAFLKLLLLILREKPDIVHTHTSKAGAVGRLAAIICQVPVVVHTFHGHVFHAYFHSIPTLLFQSIERLLARFTDVLIALGENQKKELVGFRIAEEDKIQVVPLGLELGPFLNATAEGKLRRELGFDSSTPLVGIVGRLAPVKGHMIFLNAAARILGRRRDIHFVIVGDGELRAELEQYTAGLDITDNVHFIGFRFDLPEIQRDLDVVALSSHNEGLPVALIEAMASERPVVATRVGGVSDLVTDGVTGILVPPADDEALADAILLALSNREEAGRMAAQAKAYVAERFTAQRLVRDIRELYTRLLDRSDRF